MQDKPLLWVSKNGNAGYLQTNKGVRQNQVKNQQIKFFNRLKSAWLLVKKIPLNNLLKDFAMVLKERYLFVVFFIGGGFKVFRILKITQQPISNNSIIAISLQSYIPLKFYYCKENYDGIVANATSKSLIRYAASSRPI